MRRLALLLLLAGGVPSAPSTKQVTVAQVEEMLGAAHGRADAGVAEQLAGVELTERVSSARLRRWEAGSAGSRTRQALIALADSSAFLGLPVGEVPAAGVPNVQTQTEILSRAIDYVSKTIPRLPNFVATRETSHFEDGMVPPTQFAPSVSSRMAWVMNHSSSSAQLVYQPLHFVGGASVVVTYRDGREVEARTGEGRKLDAPVAGLTTSGEFGPILEVVLADAVRSSVSWGHWEQGESGVLAVFRYQVPEEKSHYIVGFYGKTGRMERQYPGFHGEIAVDPASGSVFRLTVVSDVKAPHETVVSNIAVEYGPVEIGRNTYICPVRGVALSRVPIPVPTGQMWFVPQRSEVNDVSFTKYHVFRAESHIVAMNGEKDAGLASAVSDVEVSAPGTHGNKGAVPAAASGK